MGAKPITKSNLAGKTHTPHGGSKDSNTANQGNKDQQKLRQLNAQNANRDVTIAKKAAADSAKRLKETQRAAITAKKATIRRK